MLWVSARASDAEREARLAELPFHPLSHSTNHASGRGIIGSLWKAGKVCDRRQVEGEL
jgi:hypothetical protein